MADQPRKITPLPERFPSEDRPLPPHLVALRRWAASLHQLTVPLEARAQEFERTRGVSLPLAREDVTGKRLK